MHYTLQTRRLVVPRAGRMLVRDHRPPDQKSAEPNSASQAGADGLGGERGATAFRWAESLDYNGAENRAVMRGQVLVAYKPDEQNEPPVQLRADEVVTTFEGVARPAGAQRRQGRPRRGRTWRRPPCACAPCGPRAT
jgi:hypothetical protein